MFATRARRQAIWSETTEKFDVNRSKAFKTQCMCSRIHRLDWQKQHSNLSNSLPIMCILPLQRGRFMYFGFVGSHNELCTSHTLIKLSISNSFYIHARHRMIETARRDKNGVLQMCHGHLVSRSVTWRQRRAEVQTSQSDAIRSIDTCSWTFSRRPKTAQLRSVGELCLAW